MDNSKAYRLEARSSAILLARKKESVSVSGFRMNQRASGILLHPTSLSNRYPIGDLGPAATAFADFMVESGQRWWQMLPYRPSRAKKIRLTSHRLPLGVIRSL